MLYCLVLPCVMFLWLFLDEDPGAFKHFREYVSGNLTNRDGTRYPRLNHRDVLTANWSPFRQVSPELGADIQWRCGFLPVFYMHMTARSARPFYSHAHADYWSEIRRRFFLTVDKTPSHGMLWLILCEFLLRASVFILIHQVTILEVSNGLSKKLQNHGNCTT